MPKERVTGNDVFMSLLQGVAIGIGVLFLIGLWFLYSFATAGSELSKIDKAFSREFAARLETLPSQDNALKGDGVGAFFAPTLKFQPKAICQADGSDWGGTNASAKIAAASPIEIKSFENLGEDSATPDGKIILYFVDDKSVAHARIPSWGSGASDCQGVLAKCARTEDLTFARTAEGGFLFSAPGWPSCPVRKVTK